MCSSDLCTSSDGGAGRSATGTASPLTVTGASTGRSYTCVVRATNAVGEGPASAASASVFIGSPKAPSITGVTRPAVGQLRIAFSPTGNNGSPYTGFAASCTSSNGGVTAGRTVNDPLRRTITVTGLTPGKTYTCRVRAINARGAGRASVPTAPRLA